jgi:hypothetical protein
MSTPSLVVVVIGDTQISLRRHWGGDPEIVGRHVLDLLSAAKAAKPRSHFHTGSWLVRLLMADGDDGGTTLPTYEIECYPEGVYGDWMRAYIFKALPDPEPTNGFYSDVGNHWTIGYVEDPDGAPYSEFDKQARWFSEAEFGSFVDEELEKGLAAGKVYDITLRDAFLRSMPPDAQI